MAALFKIDSKDGERFAAALSLLNQVLGKNLYTEESLRRNTEEEGSLLLGYSDGNELVGAAMAGRLQERGRDFYAPFGKDAKELVSGNTIGVFRNSAVKSEYRDKGIGTALFAERLRWLEKIGCDYGVGLTWLHGKTIQSDRIYKAAGFQQVGITVPEFFKGMSESTGMHCPYCGFPCLCSAAMFAKKL